MQATHYRIATVVAVLLVLAAGIFLFAEKAGNHGTDLSQSSPTTDTLATTTIPISQTTSGVTGTGDFKVEAIPTIDLPTAPDFRAPIQFSGDLSPEARAHIQAGADVFIARIAKNITDLRSWIDLGTAHKMGGDLKNAEVMWQFVAKAAPKNSIAYNNLGDLYTNFLKDYSLAETNYLAAIKADPVDPGPYDALFTLYTNQYKKPAPAPENILKKGIAANPQAIELQVILARYYRDSGRSAEANATYDMAIIAADKAGNTRLSTDLKAEKANIR